MALIGTLAIRCLDRFGNAFRQSLERWVRLSVYAGAAALAGLTSLTQLRETRGAALPSGTANYNA